MIGRFPGPSWSSSHKYGSGYKNIKNKMVYYHIPKCASMWMRDFLEDLGRDTSSAWLATGFTEEPLDDYEKIIILRDPVQRWISNCPGAGKIIDIAQSEKFSDQLFNNIISWQYDEHAAPQIDFIKGLELNNAIWFRCDENLSKNIKHFFSNRGFTGFNVPAIINQQSTDESTKQSADTWKRLLEIPKYLDLFKQAYREDYELIQSVKFYDSK